MGDKTKIEWADATWNPIVGCSVISPGCTNCYAMRLAGTRMKHHPSREGLTQDSKAGPVWNGTVRLYEPALDQPLRWRWGRRIFVCAHGDLFAEQVPDGWIDRVFAVMALTPQHTYLVLTKRAKRMREYLTFPGTVGQADVRNRLAWDVTIEVANAWCPTWKHEEIDGRHRSRVIASFTQWPLPNVWLGVSVEDQQRADERIPHLLATPASRRFVSAEPLLGRVDLRNVYSQETLTDALDGMSETPVVNAGDHMVAIDPKYRHHAKLDWVIAGGESGPGARPCDLEWLRSIRAQCRSAGVACFVKQLGSRPELHGFTGMPIKDRKGGDWSEWPEDLRVREMPPTPAQIQQHMDEAAAL